MSKEERERLQAKEQQKNPTGVLNSAITRAMTGSPDGGCLVNLLSIIIIVGIIILFKACAN
ncbi:hypothetical protein ACFYKT_13795 [Cytobacillus sp. FJAT-53684]|uniref:Phage capsid protein n=1 Tax=Cytobacillus mangrovibacter TaxID=3299024 RepID=A0ABW6JZY7_9BACI